MHTLSTTGGIPPLNEEEINNFKKLINSDWLVEENKKIIREFNFSSYMEGIDFTNKVANLAEEEGHHPYVYWRNILILKQ